MILNQQELMAGAFENILSSIDEERANSLNTYHTFASTFKKLFEEIGTREQLIGLENDLNLIDQINNTMDQKIAVALDQIKNTIKNNERSAGDINRALQDLQQIRSGYEQNWDYGLPELASNADKLSNLNGNIQLPSIFPYFFVFQILFFSAVLFVYSKRRRGRVSGLHL